MQSQETIKCMDGLSFMKDMESHSVDLIVTDPPYGINYENLKWDKKDGLNWKVLAKEFDRVLKNTGALILFQGWSEVMRTRSILDESFSLKNWIIYDRIKGRGAKTNLVSTREDILWYVKNEKAYTFNKLPSTIKKKTGGTIGRRNGVEYRALSNVWTDISPIVPWSSERMQHPTQKPLALMNRILMLFSNEGDTVLDPFMGSGTTMVACRNLNRIGLGCDLSEVYYQMAKTRLNSCQILEYS